MKKQRSLFFQLCAALAAAITIATLLSSWLSFHDAEEQVEELFDAEMAQIARVIEGLVLSQRSRAQNLQIEKPIPYLDDMLDQETFQNGEYTAFGHEYERKLALQVWDKQGRLLLENKQLSPKVGTLERGFGHLYESSHNWRTFTIIGEQLDVRVAQRDDVRNELTWTIGWHAIMPQLVINTLLLALIFLIIRKSIAPLSQLAHELSQRDTDNLEPVTSHGDTLEIMRLEEEINKLFRRVSDSYERERQFTADAAHELRTPLAAANIHLENIKSIAKDPQVQSFSGKAEASIIRLRHLVEQLLTLRRMDSTTATETSILDVRSTLGSIVDELCAGITEPKISIRHTLAPGEHALIRINELEFDILVRNLIGNALKYRNRSSMIDINVSEQQLTIFNECETIDEDDIQKLFQRFSRGKGEQRQGSGLGLAICSAICKRNQLTLKLYNQHVDQRHGIEISVSWSKLQNQ